MNEIDSVRQEFIEELWPRGVIGEWYLRPKQKSVLQFFYENRHPFFEASRRFGKTNTILVYCLERMQKEPGLVVKWCEPWKNQCREIVMPEMDQIQRRIPDHLQFHYSNTDSFYEGNNGSRMYLRGVNEDQGESARGSKAHIVVGDELGSWRHPAYVLKEVLKPQLLTTRGTQILTGTPPKNFTHLFYSLKDFAEKKGRFVQRKIFDIEGTPWSEVEDFVEEMGGWESAAVKRELLCEKVVDKEFAIIPEWSDDFIQEFHPDELFPFWHKYESMDVGVKLDKTIVLFAHYDFRQAKLYVHDFVAMNGPQMTTDILAGAIKNKETVLFPNPEKAGTLYNLHKRVSDEGMLLLNDLSLLHGLYFTRTDKGTLEEMVNEVRIWVKSGRVVVHPRCTELIDCLRYGIWDDNRKQWERSDTLGHFDALAALMYLIRNVDTSTNPVPVTFGRPNETHWFTKEPTDRKGNIKKLFNIR